MIDFLSRPASIVRDLIRHDSLATALQGAIEKALLCLALFLATKPFFRIPKLDILVAQLQLLMFFFALFLFVKNSQHLSRIALTEKMIAFFLGIALISSIWSGYPSQVIMRAISLGSNFLIGLWIATQYKWSEQINMIRFVLISSLLLSAVFALYLPIQGIHNDVHWGAWKGIYGHKNLLGQLAALSAILFSIMLVFEKRKTLNLISLSIAGTVLLFSNSMQSLLSAVMTLLTLLVFYCFILGRHRWELWPVVGVFAFTFGFSQYFGMIMDWIGRDFTFTGRVSIWFQMYDQLKQTPWGNGYGYGASSYVTLDAPWFSQMIFRPGAGAHNEILQLGLQVGWLGLLVFAAFFFKQLVIALRHMFSIRISSTNNEQLIWPFAFWLFIFFQMLGENQFVSANGLYWIIFVMIAYSKDRLDDVVNKDPGPRAIPDPLKA